MQRVEFVKEHYDRLIETDYKYFSLHATGEEVETSPDYFRKVVELTPHKVCPENSGHYLLEIDDSEVLDMLQGSDTDIFYLINS